jgi:hypothetical protein
MNSAHRKPLPGTKLDYFDAQAAVDAITPGAYSKLPYTSRVLAENLVRRCDPELLTAALKQLIERKSDMDFPWFPARVVCHDILGQTALVDLAGLRDAIAAAGWVVRHVDVDREGDLVKRFGVTGVPCYVLLVKGHEVGRINGATTRGELENLLVKSRQPLGAAPLAAGPSTAAPPAASPAPTPIRNSMFGRCSMYSHSVAR